MENSNTHVVGSMIKTMPSLDNTFHNYIIHDESLKYICSSWTCQGLDVAVNDSKSLANYHLALLCVEFGIN